MKRRDFIQTVAALGAGAALPPAGQPDSILEHPRIAAVRECIRSMGVSPEYKARLYLSLYAYADQVLSRPLFAPDEGWSDFEAIQQITLEDMMADSMRADSLRNRRGPAADEGAPTPRDDSGPEILREAS